ncbi:MAG: MJ1477/TM1410 family putative glycoside hydrolase [Nitriliruptorales bacterium]
MSSWVYQLQGVDIDQLASSAFDLAVLDAEDDDGEPWTAVDLDRLASGDRIVLAYLSIGEAEDYRDYWDPDWDADGDGVPDAGAPGWLADENPDWEGNYLVRFWEPAWQEVIGARLDAIVTAGFDGAYLDIVDGYERWQDDGRPGAATDMASFVTTLADRARAQDPGFLMFPQNASGILGELDERDAAEYLDVVDGIGAEDTFFFGDAEHDNPYDPQTETIAFLDRFVAAGDVVLAVDYLTDPSAIDRFVDEARKHGYVPYAGTRELDRIVLQP